MPNFALASANSLFIEAFRAWEAAEQACSPVERLKLLEVCQAKLDEIVREHPDSDVAVQIVTRGKVGEFDLSLVAPALEGAREDVENSYTFNLVEHVDPVIDSLQQNEFEVAWTRYLRAVDQFIENSPMRGSHSDILAWRIEEEINRGNKDRAEVLVRAALSNNEEYYDEYKRYDYPIPYEYVVESLLYTGRQDDVLQLIPSLDEVARKGAIDAAVFFQARLGDRNFVETLLGMYSSEIATSPRIERIVSAFMDRDWDPLVHDLLSNVVDHETRVKIQTEIGKSYLDRGDLASAEATASRTDVDLQDIDLATKTEFVSFLIRLGGSFGQQGDLTKAGSFFKRVTQLDSLRRTRMKAEVVEALVKMDDIELALDFTGLPIPDRGIEPEILRAYFETLKPDTAKRELSRFKEYFRNEDKLRLYFLLLMRHNLFGAVERELREISFDVNLTNEALAGIVKVIARNVDDELSSKHFNDWIEDLSDARPNLDLASVQINKYSTANQVRAGIAAVDSLDDESYQVARLATIIDLIMDSKNMEPRLKRDVVKEALVKALTILERTNPEYDFYAWNFISDHLRAMSLKPNTSEYWRDWPWYCVRSECY